MAVEFIPGSTHTARVTLNNPKGIDIDYAGELKLVIGNTIYASSGLIPFSIPAGGSKDVDFPITMPAIPDTYAAYLDAYIGDVLASVFVSGESVKVLEPLVSTPVVERLFALTIPHTATYGDFEVHCHVKNIGDGVGTHQLNLVGVMNVGAGYSKEINKVYKFTLLPGEVCDCVYIDSTYRLKNVWVKAIGDWGEETPVLEFKAGYYSDDPELVATRVGTNYAILRYADSAAEYSWRFQCWTDGEQEVVYPEVRLSNTNWTTIYHAILGLLSKRTYQAYAKNGQEKHITFTTL